MICHTDISQPSWSQTPPSHETHLDAEAGEAEEEVSCCIVEEASCCAEEEEEGAGAADVADCGCSDVLEATNVVDVLVLDGTADEEEDEAPAKQLESPLSAT